MTRQQIKIGLWLLAGLLWLAGLEIRGWGQQITLGTQTKGILPVNQGGTNATDAATARANLGAVGTSDSQTLSNKVLTSPRVNDIRGYTNSLMTLLFGEVGSAVNYIGIYQAATGAGPLIQALGTDANVDLRLRPQGSGALDLGNMGAIKITGCAAGDYPRITGGNLLSCDSGSGSGAPTAASYITRTAEAGLSNETALDALSTGLLKNTAGVLSTAGAADLPNHASRHNNGGADQIGIDGGQVVSGLVADARIPTSLAGRTFTSGVTINDGGTGAQNFLKLVGVSSEPACVAGSSILYSVAGELDYCNGFNMTRYVVGNVFMTSGGTGELVYISNAATRTVQGTGYQFATAATPNTFPVRGSQGDIKARQFEAVPTNDSAAGVFQRYSSSQVNYIFEIRREDTARMAGVDKDFNWVGNVIGNITGNAATANALTSDPADCTPLTGFAWTIDSAGNFGCRAVNLASSADTTGQLAVSRLNVTGTPDSSKVLYGDRWAAPPSGGGNLGWYNVKDSPYNAAGDGVNDDTAEIQAAIDACNNSSRGGEVYIPAGIYAVSGVLYQGNGNGNTLNTKMPCAIKGAGSGPGPASTSNMLGQTVIRWTGSAPGATTYMFEMRGPFVGGELSDITFDANDKANLRGVLWENVSHGKSYNLAVTNWRTWGLVMTSRSTDAGPDYGNCDNIFSHLRMIRNSTGASGLWLTGNDVSGGRDSCSNTFYAPMIWHDNGTAGTAGIELGFADNNRFFGLNIYGFPEVSTNGSGIKFTQQTTQTSFPHENTFMSVSTHQGVTGTVGGGQPNIFYDWHLGDCYHNCDPYTVSGSVKPIVLSTDRTMKGVYTSGALYTSTNEDYETFVIEHSSGGQNGAGNIYFKRAGTNIGQIKSHYFNGLGLYTSDGTGSGSLYERLRLRNNGIMTPNSVTYSTLGGEPTGSMAYCSDCKVTTGPSADNTVGDNTCTSGGSGAFAVKVNGTWRCFATQN